MTLNEINSEFDILYNNVSSGAAPNLNEYEKSLFLTRAQSELIRMYYNGKNSHYNSFESDEEVRRYLDTLITVHNENLSNYQSYGSFKDYVVSKPDNLLYVIRETAQNASEGCLNGSVMSVIPITHESLNNVLNDPFKRPNKRKVIRYDSSTSGQVEFHILSENLLSKYNVTYLRTPRPIILTDLNMFGTDTNGNPEYTIDNSYAPSTPEIPEVLQHKVISRAVELAKTAYIGDLNTTFAINTRDL